jgi:Flp pilus assembly protein TadG
MKINRRYKRCGVSALEAAFVLPVMFTLLLSVLVGGMGVFRYQQVACLAQEAARYASVRAADYQTQTNQTPPTQAQVLSQALIPLAVGMDTTQLSLQLQWVDQANSTAYSWDTASKDVKSVNSSGSYVTNTVRATVTYNWSPGVLLGTITMTNVSELPISF